jgi:hypothetical protein
MFSLDRFYNILHSNFIQPLGGQSCHFVPFGTYDNMIFFGTNGFNTHRYTMSGDPKTGGWVKCYYFDQEPFYNLEPVLDRTIKNISDHPTLSKKIHIMANSEISDLKTQYCRDYKLYNWYYFYHGFAALDWYRDFEYAHPTVFDNYQKVFICYNHLTSKLRSYRLHLVSNLINQDLVKHGHVSLFLKDDYGTWQETVDDPDNPLDQRARAQIKQALTGRGQPLIIDTDKPVGSLSADVKLDQLTSALWHVVTETIYYDPKLHLTEKIFKPIVSKRPFILVAAPGNLAYLKRYGFKTFDRWIDESYDLEPDHYIRIEKITAEIKRLCELSPTALKQMHREMQDTLEYNYNHFYKDFKGVIVNEMCDNFSGILGQINNGRQPNNHSPYHHRYELDMEPVKKLLNQ